MTQLHDLSLGQLPYKDFAYSYGPLFLYTLYPFYLLSGESLASVPILVSDAGTAILVYLVVRHLANERLATVAGITYAISPFALLYEGYLWFSSQPMTFFILLSMYFLVIKRPLYSTLAFAVALLFKQEAIFLLPIIVLWQVKDFRSCFWKNMIVCASVLVGVSLPFLIFSAKGYVMSLTYQIFGSVGIPSLVANGNGPSISVPATIFHLSCSTFAGASDSFACTYGSFVYTSTNRAVPFWSILLQPDFLNAISIWMIFPLLGISGMLFFRLRKNGGVNLYLVGAGFLGEIFNLAFSFVVHSIYRYYLLPVYVLFLAGSTNRPSLAASILSALLSLALPSGEIQLLPPILCGITVLLTSTKAQKWIPDQDLTNETRVKIKTS